MEDPGAQRTDFSRSTRNYREPSPQGGQPGGGEMLVKITRIDCHVLLDPGMDVRATSSAQDDLVVEIHTDEGLVGIGESDLNPWIARACIEAPGTHAMGLGLREMLIGQDPLQVEAHWERLYVGSAMNGRRGAVIHALGALDIALHDLRGKALGRPCHALLGASRPDPVVPYASLQPDVSDFDAYLVSVVEWAREAKRVGFRAAKLEITPAGPYAHKGLRAPYERMREPIAAVRDAVGSEFTIMVDVQYAFPDAETCLKTIRGWDEYGVYFLETPLPSDDLAGYARVSREQPIPIAAGEWLATRFEFLELMERGRVRVVQPDVGRVGGLTEARRVCGLAAQRGLTIVPHAWKTGISIAAAAHLATVTPNCAFIEFLPAELCESALRRDLVRRGPRMVDGVISLPDAPGLGIELDRDALVRFEETAARAAR
ncbi:MAG TPA: mandelate racemase/muconate lactonizing enzyme family protein [bacterium]|nr:mandelate racemase/muconate lactonizing enzyme family protein [bacterium]